MSFLDTVILPKPEKTSIASKKSSGGFLDTVSIPSDQAKADKQAQFEKEAADAKAAADKASTVSGLFKQTISNIWNPVKDYIASSVQQAKDFNASHPYVSPGSPESRKPTDIGLPGHIVEAFRTNFTGGTDAVTQMLDDYKNGTGSTAGDVANLARLTSAVAGMLFSPVSGAFATAEDIPVLKQAADAIGIPFTMLGLAGSFASGKALDLLPISEEAKKTLHKPIEDLGSLSAQVFLGGRVMSKIADVVGKGRQVTPAEANRIINEVKTENPEVFGLPSGIPADQLLLPAPKFLDTIQLPGQVARKGTTIHTDYMKEMGYEPYVPPENLPVIEMGKPSKGDLPIIQTEAPTGRKVAGDITYEPLPKELQPLAAEARKYSAPQEFIKAVEDKKIDVPKAVFNSEASAAPIAKEQALQTFYEKSTTPAKPAAQVKVNPPIGEGETLLSKLATKVQANAVEKNLTESFGKLPEYRRVNMKEQAQFASDILNADAKKALDMALGKEQVPGHVLPEAIFTAVEEAAVKSGDVETLRRLATESPLSLEATAMGQRIRALGERQQNSPVKIIQAVRQAREGAIERKSKGTIAKVKKQIAKEIKSEMSKAVSKRPTWEEFIKEVQCKY